MLLKCKNYTVWVKNIQINANAIGGSMVNDGRSDLYDLGFSEANLRTFGLTIVDGNPLTNKDIKFGDKVRLNPNRVRMESYQFFHGPEADGEVMTVTQKVVYVKFPWDQQHYEFKRNQLIVVK